MENRLPEVLHPTLESYISLTNERLPDFLNAFYIVGSIALDEFNRHFSDVDFIAVANRLPTNEEIEVLREIHQEVEQRFSKWKLSGVYLLETDLGKSSKDIGARIVFDDDKLKWQDNFEANPITWWTLKHGGISIMGNDPRDLPIAVDDKLLVSWTLENMNTYWKSWTEKPGKLMMLLSDWGIQWAVLGVARQFYTIREKKIITKQRSGEYALTVVPEQWYRIIKEAIRIRAKSSCSLYRSRFVRLMEAAKFMKYLIEISNSI